MHWLQRWCLLLLLPVVRIGSFHREDKLDVFVCMCDRYAFVDSSWNRVQFLDIHSIDFAPGWTSSSLLCSCGKGRAVWQIVDLWFAKGTFLHSIFVFLCVSFPFALQIYVCCQDVGFVAFWFSVWFLFLAKGTEGWNGVTGNLCFPRHILYKWVKVWVPSCFFKLICYLSVPASRSPVWEFLEEFSVFHAVIQDL